MITRIREVRRLKGLTLDDVAQRCVPPTTAQTIGRLETGMRTVSIGWLNRIADALGVTAAELVEMPGQDKVPVAALLDAQGASAPTKPLAFLPPVIEPGTVGVRVQASIGDYRAGDELWCLKLPPERYDEALHRDVLVPARAGRFLFGRMIANEGGQITLLPPVPGEAACSMEAPAWVAMVAKLIRAL